MLNYALLEILVVTLLASPIVIAAFVHRYQSVQKVGAVLLLAYVVYAVKYFFFPIGFDKNVFLGRGLAVNLIPFLPLVEQAKEMGLKITFYQMFGNILAFVPFSVLTAIVYPRYRRLSSNLLFTFLASFAIELIQLLINLLTQVANRAVDINDLLLNTLGGMIGFLVYLLLDKTFKLTKNNRI